MNRSAKPSPDEGPSTDVVKQPSASDHVHKWQEDPLIGYEEERCACGYWRCKYFDGRSKKRCTDAAVTVENYCAKHKHR